MKKINYKPILGMVFIALLGACEHDKGSANFINSGAKLCYYDQGGVFGQSGIRAKEYVGKGPKMRSVQWKTSSYQDETQSDSMPIANKPEIAAQLTWRTGSSKEDELILYFDTLKLEAINLTPQNLEKVAAWQIRAHDGTVYSHAVSELEGGKLSDTFSTESKGFRIAEPFADSLGGINGGSFDVSLLDNSGNVILSQKIAPENGYKFKGQAIKAVEGLDTVVQEPQKCGAKIKGI